MRVPWLGFRSASKRKETRTDFAKPILPEPLPSPGPNKRHRSKARKHREALCAERAVISIDDRLEPIVCVCVYVYIYTCLYIDTRTHTHTHSLHTPHTPHPPHTSTEAHTHKHSLSPTSKGSPVRIHPNFSMSKAPQPEPSPPKLPKLNIQTIMSPLDTQPRKPD